MSSSFDWAQVVASVIVITPTTILGWLNRRTIGHVHEQVCQSKDGEAHNLADNAAATKAEVLSPTTVEHHRHV